MRRAVAAALLVLLLLPWPAESWGENALRLITDKAVDSLPEDLRPYFEANRTYLIRHVTDPLRELATSPDQRRNHYIEFEKYGRFPFNELPRSFEAAVKKHTRKVVNANGLLPWQIGVVSQQLTDSFRDRNWESVNHNAALLAYYVAQAHDPFKTTDDGDGSLSGQPGVADRFSANLLDRYSFSFPIRPNEAGFVADPTNRAFEICLSAHSWIENILLADRRAREGLPGYTDDYYDRFFSQAGAILARQLSDASTDVASFWLTAWINGGRPVPPGR